MSDATQNRAEALARGRHIYVGEPHGCGTSARYTNCSACVTCARRRELAKRRRAEKAASLARTAQPEALAATGYP
jgi:hypothetical protein